MAGMMDAVMTAHITRAMWTCKVGISTSIQSPANKPSAARTKGSTQGNMQSMLKELHYSSLNVQLAYFDHNN